MEIIVSNNDRKNERIFYQYKIRVELSKQISIYNIEDANKTEREQKNMAVKRIFDWIKNSNSYYDITKGNSELSIIKFQELNDSLLIFKLAKKKDLKRTIKEETFKGYTESDYPYSLVIFDYISQVLYVERNYRVFQFANNMISILQTVLGAINCNISENSNTKFFVNMITDSDKFIECYKTFDIVNKVTLSFDSPNSFLGSKKADDFLNEIRDETQAKKTSMVIQSDEGLLGNGILSFFDEFFTYITNGGGSWSMSGKPRGKDKKMTKNSKTKIKSLNLTMNISIDQSSVNNANEIIQIIEDQNRFKNEE